LLQALARGDLLFMARPAERSKDFPSPSFMSTHRMAKKTLSPQEHILQGYSLLDRVFILVLAGITH
jgi:hypothetical protein